MALDISGYFLAQIMRRGGRKHTAAGLCDNSWLAEKTDNDLKFHDDCPLLPVGLNIFLQFRVHDYQMHGLRVWDDSKLTITVLIFHLHKFTIS